MRTTFAILFALVAVTLPWQADAGGKLEKSDSKVKATATAGKIGADGKQTVTIEIAIEKGWHLYANPVNHNNDFLNGNKTIVKVGAKEKLVSVSVKYPEGKTKTDGKDSYDVYTGVIKLQADVVRAKGDASPLEISIAVSACDKSVCLDRGMVKLTAP
jgi:DsbC/DsbD-like thiol-disulfide interchange protein